MAARLDPDGSRFDAARALLERHFGYQDFRAPQTRVVRSVLDGHDTLGVLPTGAGKSVCFQVPALLQDGLTLVISPLLALMADQVDSARRRGLAARSLTSLQDRAAQDVVRAELGRGEVRLLYVAPERGNRLVAELTAAGAQVGLLAVDEAHCIAEWGPDFRPAYRALGRLRKALGWPQAVALTGSATAAGRSDIVRTLGLGRGRAGGYRMHLGSFDRRNLWFGVEAVRDEAARLEALLRHLAAVGGRGIVYGPTRNAVEALARVLRYRGFGAVAYHAGLGKDRRAEVLAGFLADRIPVIAATCAFGMGIDKPDVRLVLHWTMPPTPEAYYQEAGRAGRDGAASRCILLHRAGDGDLPRRELDVTFPPRSLLERVWREPAVAGSLPRNVAASVERLTRELRPDRGPVDWHRIAARRRAAEARIAAVERYAVGRECRRAMLLRYFGEPLIRCSGCDRCGVRTPA
ncbi:MAG: ATP-dependent DNA helicase RecQ [Gemmatimonadales bacterium]